MPPLSAQQTAALRNMQADNNIPPIPRWDTSPATLPAHVVALSNWLHDYADRKYTNHSSSSTRLGRERSTLCAAHHPTISTSSDTTPLRKATGNCRASSSCPTNPDPTTSRIKTLTAKMAKMGRADSFEPHFWQDAARDLLHVRQRSWALSASKSQGTWGMAPSANF